MEADVLLIFAWTVNNGCLLSDISGKTAVLNIKRSAIMEYTVFMLYSPFSHPEEFVQLFCIWSISPDINMINMGGTKYVLPLIK